MVSFAVTDHDYVFPKPAKFVDLSAKVTFRDFEINMLILGMRNLESPGILPVKKAFVNFNVKSLVPPNGPAVKNIKTEPQSPGSNPTLNTTMKFNIPLPVDPLYCPRLACAVFDCIFRGWSQPLIGNFDIPIGQLMLDLAEERATETQVIVDISEEIEKMLTGETKEEDIPISYGPICASSEEDYSDLGSSRSQAKSLKDESKEALRKAKTKKKVTRILKNDESISDYTESFGANEDDGEMEAMIRKEDQLEAVKRRK